MAHYPKAKRRRYWWGMVYAWTALLVSRGARDYWGRTWLSVWPELGADLWRLVVAAPKPGELAWRP
jgi:hypothetical protein